MENNCLFCKIIDGVIPSHKIYEDENTLAFLDISADTLGHTLVISKTHTQNFVESPKEVLDNLMQTVQKIAKHYIQNVGFDGVQILTNNGESAGQSIMHLHFHILPSTTPENKKFEALNKTYLKSVSEKLKV